MALAYPIQGFGRSRIRRLIAIGGDWDEFSAFYNNDTNSVTLSSNGTAKSYNQYVPYVQNTNNPLKNYLVLIIQVSGYITLASGSSSGSATISIVLNGTTLYSTTITNTSNEVVINEVIPYSQFPSNMNWNWFNTLEIQVTLGSGTQSVTITQVQYMFGILLEGGSSGLTVTISGSQPITYINDDPNIFSPDLANAFGVGMIIAHYDPFGMTTGQATYSINNGQVNLNANSTQNIWMLRAIPVSVQNGQVPISITITVPANQSVLIGYFVISVIVNALSVTKGYLKEDIYIRYLQLGNPDNGINFENGVLGVPAIAFMNDTNITTSLSNFINQGGSCCSLGVGWFNWSLWQSYANHSPAYSVGNSYIYLLTYTTPKALVHVESIAFNFGESDHGEGVYRQGVFQAGGMVVARIAYVEVEE